MVTFAESRQKHSPFRVYGYDNDSNLDPPPDACQRHHDVYL